MLPRPLEHVAERGMAMRAQGYAVRGLFPGCFLRIRLLAAEYHNGIGHDRPAALRTGHHLNGVAVACLHLVGA